MRIACWTLLALAVGACGKSDLLGLESPDLGGVIDSGPDTGLDVIIDPDGGAADATEIDAGQDGGIVPDGWIDVDVGPPPDVGVLDASAPDVPFVPDSGLFDANTPDSGSFDAGRPDGNVPDSGRPDGNVPDAGRPDASAPDAGPECLMDNDCNRGDRCEPNSLTCVDCYQDSHCGGNQRCDLTTFDCRPPCFNGNCGPLGVCDPATDLCVECLTSNDCDGAEVCANHTCVECATNADCALSPGQPICSNNECTGCVADSDCPTGQTCSPLAGGTCVAPTGRGLCEPCDNDTQCGGANDLCIGLVSQGGLIDRTCATDCSSNPMGCPSGFACVSVRNGSAQQCRPRYEMQNPTCTATRNLGEACVYDPNTQDPGCGISGLNDARCFPSMTSPGGGICAVFCTSNAQCASGTTCTQFGTQGVCL